MSSPTQSDNTNSTTGTTDGDAPSFEPWIKVSLAGFVPLALAFFVPDEVQAYLLALGGALVLWSLVMLVRLERGKSADRRA